jgi:threonine/homoserine/homoserine lactone efflux protein
MRVLWTLLKIVIGLAIAIPLGMLALALTLGVLGTLFGLAMLALKLACIALVGYGAFRILRRVVGRSPRHRSPRDREPLARELPAPDPYYRAAMRELDAELGHSVR